jgi:hypothetical protein
MAFTTPFVRTATFTEITPAAACPAAKPFAVLIVEDTTEVGTNADAALCASSAANAPPDKATPRPVSRFVSITLAVASRLATIPSGIPSCRAASLRVLLSKSHRTMTARYLSGRRLNSSSRTGCRSRQRSFCSAKAGSGISIACLSLAHRLAKVARALSAVWWATPYSQLASSSLEAIDATFRTKTRTVACKASSASW